MINKKVILTLLPLVLCSSCASITNKDISNYKNLLVLAKNNSDFHTQLHIFPDNTDKGTPKDFVYKSSEDLFTGSYVFYLLMEYDEATFNSELERLSEVEAHFPEDMPTKHIIHYPDEKMYLTISRDNRYEYAKYFEDTHAIAYVSNQLKEWPFSGVPIQYRLGNIKIPPELDDDENTYNLYYSYTFDPELGGLVGAYTIDD